MREWLAGSIADCAGRPTVELFAGSGNFTEVLAAGGCRPLLAVDSAGDALAAARSGRFYECILRACRGQLVTLNLRSVKALL